MLLSRATPVRAAGAALLAAALAAPPAGATLVRPLTVADLTRGSDAVVRGRVSRIATVRAASGMPVTRIELEVLEVLAGSLPPLRRITVTQPGGTLDGVRLDYAGRPRFEPGQETVLFLERRGASFITHALAQGKFDVLPADAAGRRGLRRTLAGAALASGPTEAPPPDLETLRARVAATPRTVAGGRP